MLRNNIIHFASVTDHCTWSH